MRYPDTGARGGAVALVHGAGPQTRDGPFGGYLRAIAELFAAAGVVALTYDKRGCGESSGEWETASFADLAADASAAVDLLQGVDGVDRVGLWGSSQAGWILPLVAAQSELATVIVVSGAGCDTTRTGTSGRRRRRGYAIWAERGIQRMS